MNKRKLPDVLGKITQITAEELIRVQNVLVYSGKENISEWKDAADDSQIDSDEPDKWVYL